jgi:hypothetical protein
MSGGRSQANSRHCEIPAKLRPSAFAIVADLLLADGKIDARERKFRRRLAVDFHIGSRVASQVIEVMLVKNHS